MFKMLKAFAISLLIFHSFSHLASSSDTLKPGDKLNSQSVLVSAQKIFTLGFYTPKYSSSHSYLGIWYTYEYSQSKSHLAIAYTNPKDFYPVWLANRNMPVYNDTGILTITNNGKLIITHAREDPIELYASESGKNITATLLDSGNLVVKEMVLNEVVWQSFDYPTDVLLPGMKLGINHRTGKNWTLTSWFSGYNPASGAFTLEWDTIRRRLVIRRRGIVYWTSGNLKPYYQGSNLNLPAFDYIFPGEDARDFHYNFLNVSNEDEEYFTYALFQVPFLKAKEENGISRWRLDYQGLISDYERQDRIAYANLCYGYRRKGRNLYLGGEWGRNFLMGCELRETPKCRNSYQLFSPEYGNFDFTVDYFYDSSSNLSHSDCMDACWNDCNCIGFVEEETGCSYWRGKNAGFLDKGGGPSKYVLRSYEPEKRRILMWIIISVAIVAVLLSILGSAALLLVRRYKKGVIGKRKKNDEFQELPELMKLEGYTEESELEINGGGGPHLKQFTYASILASTNCFALENKLGEGGFGPVYKGKISDGREIAIKLLSRRSEQGLVEFKTELILISKLQHRNLVKLVGFCIHRDEKMIIYEYMPNASLDFYLFNPEKREQLKWEQRFNIIEGVAQGLLYLHKYSRVTIVHRDLKASSILLDEDMCPKISDFGMARIFRRNAIEANTFKPAGTYGYMAPEYAMQGLFSIKSDIYSFGVLILEIVSGRKNNSFQHLEGPLSLIEFAWELYKESAELELMDSTLKNTGIDDQVRRCIHVGLLCVENEATNRPHIEDVISMLKNEMVSLPLPKKPAFLLRNDDAVQNVRQPKTQKYSRNEFSVSIMDGR